MAISDIRNRWVRRAALVPAVIFGFAFLGIIVAVQATLAGAREFGAAWCEAWDDCRSIRISVRYAWTGRGLPRRGGV